MLNFFKTAIKKGRVSHSYLFVGENEEEKKRVALEFTQMLGCSTNPPHPDLKIIAPEGSLKIDEIRELERWISLKPYSAKWKVTFILRGELMTEEAANALLKTLEEPPAHSLLIIFSNNIRGLLPTIVSRCQIVRFTLLNNSPMANSPDIASGDLTGLTSLENEKDLLTKSKEEREEIFRRVLSWWRDILIFKLSRNKKFLFNKGKVEAIEREAERYSCEELEQNIEIINQTNNLLKHNVNPKIAFASMRLKLNEATI
ncbi:MAG: hypothetical protein J7J51_04810 [Candidatus Omnitrophica bacterium]|nr:hypothetical protein [Candidatus Omnitrophota bacterium]